MVNYNANIVFTGKLHMLILKWPQSRLKSFAQRNWCHFKCRIVDCWSYRPTSTASAFTTTNATVTTTTTSASPPPPLVSCNVLQHLTTIAIHPDHRSDRHTGKKTFMMAGAKVGFYVSSSVTRLGNLLDFGQLFKAFCNN